MSGVNEVGCAIVISTARNEGGEVVSRCVLIKNLVRFLCDEMKREASFRKASKRRLQMAREERRPEPLARDISYHKEEAVSDSE